MPLVNSLRREITCKLVYYGTGLGGKTTNLQYIYSQLAPTTRGELITLQTETDRTLYFDFLPIDLGTIDKYNVKFAVYTVPGQVEYNRSRKLILNGVDGIVFVADSDVNRSTDNVESFDNMLENLAANKLHLEKVPCVLQYNKRDLMTAMPVERMQHELNPRGLPAYEATATQGLGVFLTLKGLSDLVMKSLEEAL